MLSQRENRRVEIDSIYVNGEISDSLLQNAYIEVMREIFLNIEKHTRATVASVDIKFDEDRKFLIEIYDNSYLDLDQADRGKLLLNSAGSKSLHRLLELIPAQLSITSTTDGLVYRISPTVSTESTASSLEIHQSRNQGLLGFAFNLIKSVSIIGILYIPGYLFLEVDPIKVILLIMQAITLFLLAFRKTFSAILLAISTWISIATPVFISFDVTTCSEVLFTPWMANIALTATLSFALLSKHRIQRWIPLGIFTIELLVLPLTYPDGCKNIFIGTLPGIPLIISFYLVISSIRKRAFNEDSQQIRDAYEDETNVEKTEALLDYEFETVLINLERFNGSISEIKQGDLVPEIELQIQRLRAFLICSEQFESQVVRDFYRFAVNRLEDGKSTRISLLGDHFFVLDGKIDSAMLFSKLGELLVYQPSEITLLRVDEFTVEVAVSDTDQITEEATELFFKFPQAKLAIRSLA
jgi:signal transduction histidine kinase